MIPTKTKLPAKISYLYLTVDLTICQWCRVRLKEWFLPIGKTLFSKLWWNSKFLYRFALIEEKAFTCSSPTTRPSPLPSCLVLPFSLCFDGISNVSLLH